MLLTKNDIPSKMPFYQVEKSKCVHTLFYQVACDVCKELDPLIRAYLEKNATQVSQSFKFDCTCLFVFLRYFESRL